MHRRGSEPSTAPLPVRRSASLALTPTVALALGLLLATLLAGPASAASQGAARDGHGGREPRLTIKRIRGVPATAIVGERFGVRVAVRNLGRTRGRSPVKLVGRDSSTSGRDVRLGRAPAAAIGPRGRRRFKINARALRRLLAGRTTATVRLRACLRRGGLGTPFRCKRIPGRLRVGPDAPAPRGFEPGARSAGDPLFPQEGNGGYDATHYEIALDYDPADNSFGAGTRTSITAVATQDLSELSLDFQRDLAISSVKVDGVEAAHQRVDAKPRLSDDPRVTQPAKLVITPPGGIPAGHSFIVAVRYRGTPVEITDADTSIEGWARACAKRSDETSCDGSFVANEPNGAQSWFPSNNYPTDKASITTSITAPNDYTALGTGELASRAGNGDGTRTWVWNEDSPTATFLTTATVGRFRFNESSMVEAVDSRELPVYVAVDQSVPADLVGPQLDRMPSMINFLASTFGPYPFDSTGAIVDHVPSVGYALEVQTKPVYSLPPTSPTSASTVLHELSHQWWGDSVSPSSWLEIWHSEGWAQWSEWYWGSEANGSSKTAKDHFDEEYAGTKASDWAIAPAKLDGDPANLFAEFPTYVRGAMTLEGYREIVGDRHFFEFAAELQRRYEYTDVSTAEIIATAKSQSGLAGAELKRLGEYFDQWLYGTVKPTIAPANF